jgi:autotransporter-associated beta strand protein
MPLYPAIISPGDASNTTSASEAIAVGLKNSISRSLPGSVKRLVFIFACLAGLPLYAQPVWNGGGGPADTDWSQAVNWGGVNISAGNALNFSGTVSLNNTNDTPADTQYGNITFTPGAGPFVLNGNNIEMGAGILTNNSSNPQTIALGVDFGSSFVFGGGSSTAAPLIIGGGLNDSGSGTVIWFNGCGVLSNTMTSVGVNAMTTTNANANWTLLDNPASTPMILPWGFEILAGTFTFGSATSAPNLLCTPGQSGINGANHQIGDVSGATGTFNMVNGILSTMNPVNISVAANSTGILNQTGGTLNVGGFIQGANGAVAGQVAIMNLSGGTLNLTGSNNAAQPRNIYVASRGTGALTVSGSAVVNCAILDCSRNANGNSIASVGVVNLNGGTLNVNQVDTANDNGQTGGHPTAAFNFNGGILRAAASSTNFFGGRTTAPITPITTMVLSGGAIIDDGGFSIFVNEPLQHGSALGATNDGGLAKLGAGTLILSKASTYTGPTFVENGALALTNAGNLSATSAIDLANNTTLDLSGMTNQLVNPNTLSLANAKLALTIPLNPTSNVVVGTLVLGGTSNIIEIAQLLPVLTSYPTTFHLINYSNTLNLTNFVLAPLPASSGTPYVAHLNAANPHLLDLVFTAGPAPARQLVWAGTDTADNASLAWDVANSFNWTNAQGAATTYNQLDFVRFDDTTSPRSPTPGQVQLFAVLTPSTLTVSNNLVPYIFTSAGGYLADPSSGSPLQLIKQGTGKLIMDSTAPNTYTGGTVISAGSTVQIGNNNDGLGDLGAGPVTDNGALIFDSGNRSFANVISGSGSILQNGAGTVNLSGANGSFNGTITIATNSVLQAGNTSSLGAASSVNVENGGVLDLNGQSLGATPVFAQGTGNIPNGGNSGAIDNSSATAPAGNLGLEFITLTGDTTLTASGSAWNLQSPGGDAGAVGDSAATSTAALSTGGQPYNLTIDTSTQFGVALGIVSAWVDPQLANIDVAAGTLDYEGNTSGLGNPANTLTVESEATLELNNAANPLNKVIAVNSPATVLSISGSNNIAGPVVLANAGSISTFNIAANATLNLLGHVSGEGTLQLTALLPVTTLNAGTLILNGGNSFTGSFMQLSGTNIIYGDNSLMTNYSMVEGGAFIVNGVFGGSVTNIYGTLIAGSGTNLGAVDVGATLAPGALGTVGTFTVGAPSAMSSLTLEGSANLSFDLAEDNTPGGGVNDLVVVNGDLNFNGGTLTINPLNILKLNVPYTLITYSSVLNVASLPAAITSSSYVLSLHTEVPGRITVVATGGAPPVWNGGAGPANTDWSQAANWSGVSIAGASSVYFGGTSSLNNTNDTGIDTQFGYVDFIPGAGPFVLNGDNIELGGTLANNSSNPQTVELGVDFSASIALNGGSSATAPLIIGGGLNGQGNATVTYLNGFGILSNNFAVPGGTGTNAITTTNSLAYWTIVDNSSSTPVAVPWGFEVMAGTINFGSATSAPNLLCTPGQSGVNGLNHQIGNVPLATGTFNMVNGTLTTMDAINVSVAANATGVLNQTGGTLNVGGWMQAANGAFLGQLAFINISGGTLNLTGSNNAAQPANLYIASRGTGTLTVSGSGAVNCQVLDCSRNASGAGGVSSVGTVNLNGGTLNVSRVDTANDNAEVGGQPAAAFNFNGGVLEANASSASFFQGSIVPPVIPITTTVKSGGAIINDASYTIGVLEPLQHDATLGVTNDGGLAKIGSGTLTLGATNTYTGPTVIRAGTLALGSTASISNSASISIAAGATFNASGRSDGTLTLSSGQALEGSGAITGALTAPPGSIVAPGSNNVDGTLTVSKSVVLAGTTEMKLGGAANDELIASSGSLSYGGTLVVTNVSGAALVSGQTFTLFNASTYANSFSSITLPALGANLAWQNNLGLAGTISVVSTTASAPGINQVLQLGGNLIFGGVNGTHNGLYYVLSSTNLALPLTNWTVLSTNMFDASGKFSVTNPIVAGPSKFFILSVP